VGGAVISAAVGRRPNSWMDSSKLLGLLLVSNGLHWFQ
jgi:hypothetical protein